jgi:hypothetical protein
LAHPAPYGCLVEIALFLVLLILLDATANLLTEIGVHLTSDLTSILNALGSRLGTLNDRGVINAA